MRTIEEEKEIFEEIAALLRNANKDQKILIKGILLGAQVHQNTQSAIRDNKGGNNNVDS